MEAFSLKENNVSRVYRQAWQFIEMLLLNSGEKEINTSVTTTSSVWHLS